MLLETDKRTGPDPTPGFGKRYVEFYYKSKKNILTI